MSRHTETTLETETTEKLSGKGKLSRVTGNSTVRSRDSSLLPLSIAERFMSISSDTSTSSIPKVTNYNIKTTSKPLSLDHGPLFSPLNHNMQEKINTNAVSLKQETPIHPLDRNKKIDTTKKKAPLKPNPHRQNCRHTKTKEKPKLPKQEEAHIIVCESQETLVHSTQNEMHVKKKNQSYIKREPTTGVWIGPCCFIQATHEEDGVPLPPLDGSTGCLGRRMCVMMTFCILVLLIVLGFVLWPRTPLIRIEGASETVPAQVTQTKQGEKMGNVSFQSQWLLNITVDNRCNYLTTRLNRIKIIAKDNLTGLMIGKGTDNSQESPTPIYLPGHIISTIQLPVSVNYQARDSSDTTFSNLNRACISKSNGTRESLSLHFWFTLYIFGLDWTNYRPTIIASPANGGFLCPQTTVTQ